MLERAPVQFPVQIYWNENRIPYIVAKTDDDLAVAMGIVHAHLRGSQLQMFRRVAQGRLAESFGPPAVKIDHMLRLLNVGMSADRIIADMEPESRRFADSYLKGLNYYIERSSQEWPDLRAMNIEVEPFTLKELVTIWRLFSVDVNWFRMFAVLSEAEESGVSPETLWQRRMQEERRSTQQLAQLLASVSRSGSNSVVLAPSRTQSGASMIASDPHVGLFLPSLWFIMGVKSPSYEAVGLTIPGLPGIALGRSRYISWGGTNLWGLSTALVKLTGEEIAASELREETIRVRGWFDSRITVRTSTSGPVLSGSPYVSEPGVAFSWIGHQSSDELATYLKIMKAKDCTQFRQAFQSWAVSGQNYLCADTRGNIMHVLAYRRPVPGAENRELLREKSARWQSFENPTQLAYRANPPSGFLASANDRPIWSNDPIGYFFSSHSRVGRIERLVAGRRSGPEDLRLLQLDVCSEDALAGRNALFEQIRKYSLAIPPLLAEWDGCYMLQERAPFMYERMMSLLRDRLELPPESGEDWEPVIDALKRRDSRAILEQTMAEVEAEGSAKWTLLTPVQHPLGFIPVIGSRWRLGLIEEPGATQTLYKRGFRFENGVPTVSYGANARHVSDMADLDANYFVLFGGQDGMMVSPTTADQIDLWKAGRWIRVPLRLSTLMADGWATGWILPLKVKEEGGLPRSDKSH